MKDLNLSRREFFATSSAAALALVSGKVFGAPAYIPHLGKPNSLFKGVQVGVISYSWRSMPGSVEDILRYCIESNISAIELMGDSAEKFAGAPVGPTLPPRSERTDEHRAILKEYENKLAAWRTGVQMDKFIQIRKMYNAAGVKIFGFKPSALGTNNSDAEVDYALRAAKALGANQANVELPKTDAETLRLGKIADKNKIFVGYHGHTQQTPTWWDTALGQAKYNAMNFDLGHYVAAGYEPIDLLKAKHDRIVSMHVKDRKSKANGGANLPWGEGDTPIVEVLQLMRKNKYKFPATIELEYEVPAGSDAVKETARCVEYARKALGA
jgi:sugar phosphate isomerase/epimerase